MQKSPKKAHFQFPISSQSQKMGENQAIFPHFSGAGGRARTDTNSRSRDFKSLASANSTTPACFLYEICIYSFFAYTQQILSPLEIPQKASFLSIFASKTAQNRAVFMLHPNCTQNIFRHMGVEFSVPRNQCDLGDRRTRIIPNIQNYFLPFFESSSTLSRYAFSTSLKVFA